MRPFVYRLATLNNLFGEVWNDSEGVHILLQGSEGSLDSFYRGFVTSVPKGVQIDQLAIVEAGAQTPFEDFRIGPSVRLPGQQIQTRMPADLALCEDCLSEMLDVGNRRYRYPFINCTQCGPRYTLIESLPYDRPNTSMRAFPLCAECLAEYENPSDRRFHAQPNACPQCGPRLQLWDLSGGGQEVGGDPLKGAVQRIQQGDIVAVKGIGGFLLVCDARMPDTVARLRERKGRPHKPFAVMAPNRASLRQWVCLTEQEEALLSGPISPIVLCESRQTLPGVAPGVDRWGVMLPYSPLHFLLFHQAVGCPELADWLHTALPHLWIMTSANRAGSPIVKDNEQALEALTGLADAAVCHDRDILQRCDDSLWLGGRALRVVRSARGMAPTCTTFSAPLPPLLAMGAGLKSTVCVAAGNQAFLSAHIGDMSHPDTCQALDETAKKMMAAFAIDPAYIITDVHPDLYSTEFGERLARAHGAARIPVFHHHAHVGAVLAEWGLSHDSQTACLGVALDGVGLGEDGQLWGGELFQLAEGKISRLGHLSPLPLPGGDAAAREPWRMAMAALSLLPKGERYLPRFTEYAGYSVILRMIEKGIQCPMTTSAGRWFDAIAGLLGVCDRMTYEAQAAMQLEACARKGKRSWPSEFGKGFTLHEGVLGFLPVLNALAEMTEPDSQVDAARLWHEVFTEGVIAWIEWAVASTGIRRVALGGGCLLNQIVYDRLEAYFKSEQGAAIEGFLPIKVPCNDGGISLGQIWIAAYLGKLNRGTSENVFSHSSQN